MVPSLLLIVAALLFKQTAAAISVIPGMYVVLFERPLRMRRLVEAALPFAAVVLTLIVIRLAWPALFQGMVTVPSLLTIQTALLLTRPLEFFASFPIIFLVAALLCDGRPLQAAEKWVVAALVILCPACFLAEIKSGGASNSMLLVYLGFIVLAGVRMEGLLNTMAGSLVTAIALVASFLFQFDRVLPVLFSQCGDDKYSAAVDLARSLGPGAICPQDPSISFRANGTYERALYFELDAHPDHGEWPQLMPSGIADELRAAPYVIRADFYVPVPQFSDALPQFGFHPVKVPQLDGSMYSLWAK